MITRYFIVTPSLAALLIVLCVPSLHSVGVVAQQDRFVANDRALDDRFGHSIAISGNIAIVGAPFDDGGGFSERGSAYVFVRSGTTWIQEAKLEPLEPASNKHFGSAVAISGNIAFIGAARESAVYMFVRNNGAAWTGSKIIEVTGGTARLGESIAFDGTTMVVGRPGTQNPGGSAFVVTLSAEGMRFGPVLRPADGAADDNFGSSVAVDGNTIVVGSRFSNRGIGAAYVFVGSGGTWDEETKLVAGEAGAPGFFGTAVAVRGNRILVGAPGDLSAGKGAAYAFQRVGSTWTQEQKFTNPIGVSDDFGRSVALDGDLAAVGEDSRTVVDSGAVHLFRRVGSVWTTEPQLLPQGPTRGFGGAVAIQNQTIVVGAPDFTPTFPAIVGPGAAFAFLFDAAAAPAPPPPPAGLAPPVLSPAIVIGSTVTINWTASIGATNYRVRAGTSAGGSNAHDANVGNRTSVTAENVASGSYFVRVHAVGADESQTGPSNEVRVDVGVASPCAVPAPPTNLQRTVAGTFVTLTWTTSVGATSYVVEAGSFAGAANLAVFSHPLPPFAGPAPPGTYFVRVRARSACGATSLASNEVTVVVN